MTTQKDMEDTEGRRNRYTRAIVLAGITGVVSLVILTALSFNSELFRPWFPLLLTFEVSLVAVTITDAVVTWVKGLSKDTTKRLIVQTCPDYWTQSNDAATGAPRCQNSYTSPVTGDTYKILGQSTENLSNNRVINLSSHDGQTKSRATCEAAVAAPQSSWTDLAPYCDALMSN